MKEKLKITKVDVIWIGFIPFVPVLVRFFGEGWNTYSSIVLYVSCLLGACVGMLLGRLFFSK